MARRFSYEAVPGFFVQSEASPTPDPHPPAFGLKEHTSATYWGDFQAQIKNLQSLAPSSTRYVVCWIARHGQGWHNVAVDKYGIDEWERRWSKKNGNGEITWGPDAKLTPLGEAQARGVNEVWKAELARLDDPIPIPTKLFSSPLARALATTDITFKDVIPKDNNTGDLVSRPRVLENLREQLAPYTSEHRSSKTQIQNTYPAFEIEDGFTEEDKLWSPHFSESDTRFNIRMRATLDRIFGDLLESTDTFISITSHSGVAAAILRIVGHRSFPLPAGGVIPVVIKVTAQS